MDNYFIQYNNGSFKTVEGVSKRDAEERLKRSTKGIVLIQNSTKISNKNGTKN